MKKECNNLIEKTRTFFSSNIFMIITFIMGAIVNIWGEFIKEYKAQVAGTIVFGIIISAILVICDDILSVFYPSLVFSMFVLKCYNSFSVFIPCPSAANELLLGL